MKDKPVILVVDDQPQNIELLEAYLVPQGYEIVKAANGEEALGKLSGNQIDLILLDVMMPGMDGFEVTRRVRQDNTHRLLPIILVTALRETEDRVKGIEAGCDDFISKPVDKMELLARVRSLLKVKAYNDLMSNYRKELESEVTRRTEELKHALENLQQDIAERKQMEAALLKSEERYRVIFEGSTQGILITDIETRRFLYANPSICQMFGYSDVELLQLSIADIHPKDSLGQLISDFKSQTQGKKPISSAIPCLRKDGTVFYAHITGANTKINGRECSVGFFLDITKREQAQQALRESEKKYHDLYDFLPIPVYEMDFEANITSANRAIYETFRGTEEDLKKGFKGWQLLSPEEIEKSSKNIERLLKGEKIEGTEYTLMRLDGSVFPAIVISSVIYSNGKPVGLRSAIVDITERKRAEEVLKESENKYRLLADNVNDVIFVLDMNLNYTYVSPSVKILRGYEPEEVLKQPPFETLTPSSWDLAMRTLSEIMELEKSERREIPISRTLQLEMSAKRWDHRVDGGEVFLYQR